MLWTDWRSADADELLALAAEIDKIRSQLVLGKNPMVERFRAYRALRGANVPGEPKLATQFLIELQVISNARGDA